MINGYKDYIIEQLKKEIIILSNQINESDQKESLLIRKLTDLVNFALEKGNNIGMPILKAFWDVIKWNKYISLTLFSLLMFKFGLTAEEIYNSFGEKREIKELINKAGQSNIGDDQVKLSVEDSKIKDDEILKINDFIDKAKDKAQAQDDVDDIDYHKGDLIDFMKAVAFRESSWDPGVVNSCGFMGLYQMGNDALSDMGMVKQVNTKKFIWSKHGAYKIFPIEDQNKAMIKLMRLNKKRLQKHIEKYVGRTISCVVDGNELNIPITESGLLAGAHLLGSGNVMKFLNSNGKIIPKDGNASSLHRTPITEYINKFSHYNMTQLNSISLEDIEDIDIIPGFKKGSKFRSWVKLDINQKSPNKP
jgi:hypothetical protein